MKKIYFIVTLCLLLIGSIFYGVKRYKFNNEVVFHSHEIEGLTIANYRNGDEVPIDSLGKPIGNKFDYILGSATGCLSFVVSKDLKRGYRSTLDGKELFPPQFDHAWIDNPKFGLAAVVKNNKLGFVNVLTGEVSIPPQFEFERHHLYYDYVFRDNGYCIVPGKNKKFGLINTSGELVLDCDYEDISFTDYGFIRIKAEDKFGLLDSSMNVIFPPIYDKLKVNDLGIILCKLDYEAGHKQYLLSHNGKDVISNLWLDDEYLEGLVIPFYEPALIKYDENGNTLVGERSRYSKFYIYDRYGVVDDKLNIIIPAVYDYIAYIGSGYFSCELDDQGAVLNHKGEYVHD